MSAYADPMFGPAARRGFAARRPSVDPSRIDPPEPPQHVDRDEPAPYCSGPGHLYAPHPIMFDREPGDLLIRIEECPSCLGQIRNHRASRRAASAQIARAFR